MQPDQIKPDISAPTPSLSPAGGTPSAPKFDEPPKQPEPSQAKPIIGKNKSSKKPLLWTLIVIILLVLVGGGIYYWQNNKLKTANQTISALQLQNAYLTHQLAVANQKSGHTSATAAYPITQTTPSTYKTYSNSSAQFSIAYPPTWTYKVDPTSTASNDPITFQMQFYGSTGAVPTVFPVPGYAGLSITSQSLSQALSYYQQAEVTDYNSSSSAATYKTVSTTNYTFKGYPATLLTTDSVAKTGGATTYEANMLVYANKQTYNFFSASTNADPFSDQTVSTVLQSLKFN